MSRWFRHYAGMMRDEKLVRVSIKTKQPIERVLWIWGAILESAAEIDDGGRYDVDPAEVAYFLRASDDDTAAIFDALGEAGRVANGSVVNWGARQFQSDRSAGRVAAYRERKRASGSGCNDSEEQETDTVTLQKRPGNSPETETETETKKKRTPQPPKGDVVPDWIPVAPWDGYVRMRKSIRKPITPDGVNIAITKLAELKAAGHDPGEVLKQSTFQSWQGLFEVKAGAKAAAKEVTIGV